METIIKINKNDLTPEHLIQGVVNAFQPMLEILFVKLKLHLLLKFQRYCQKLLTLFFQNNSSDKTWNGLFK